MTSSQKIAWSIILMIAIAASWYFIKNSSTGDSAKVNPCVQLTGDERATCEGRMTESDTLTSVIQRASEAGDTKLCNTLAESARGNCRDIVYLGNALKSRNIEDCQWVQNTSKRAACIKSITPVSDK